jgi:transposase
MKPAAHSYAVRWWNAFGRGYDTYDISRVYNVSEATVYNTLARIKGQLHDRTPSEDRPSSTIRGQGDWSDKSRQA